MFHKKSSLVFEQKKKYSCSEFDLQGGNLKAHTMKISSTIFVLPATIFSIF
jgi:hypothetical protein